MSSNVVWQDGDCCFRCRTQFTLVARKHHCRNCGNIFCAKCSSQQIPLPKLNIDKNVRVCDTCYEKVVGKTEDPLTLALSSKDREELQEQSTKSRSRSKSASDAKSSASAPSEQELKEEEELQLALALSLSETPIKSSVSSYRNDLPRSNNTTTLPTTSKTTNSNTIASNEITQQKLNSGSENSNSTGIDNTPSVSGYDLSAIYSAMNSSTTNTAPAPIKQSQQSSQQQPQPAMQTSQPLQQQTQSQSGSASAGQSQTTQQAPTQPEFHIQERDQELFKYINDVHGTLEVFINRMEACKLRNRPVSNDAAIQSLFIKLNSEIQPKLTEYIKTYEEERGVHERLQDKLSQISDARAALDALREEHREQMRQMAAEAEKQRQSQLATKLEAMRQKKTQMMQYQRELAMQRIREQEMMYQNPSSQPNQHVMQQQEYQVPAVTGQALYQNSITEQDPIEHAIQQAGQTMPSQSVRADGPQLSWSQQDVAKAPTSAVAQQQYQRPYIAQAGTASNHPVSQIPQTSGPQQSYNSYTQQYQSAPTTTAPVIAPPSIDRSSIAQLEKQFLPDAKPDDEAPLISFDD